MSDGESISRQTQVDVLVLSWQRPLLLAVTLHSLTRAMSTSTISWKYRVVDQGSGPLTRWVIEHFTRDRDHVEFLTSNIGSGNGWRRLINASESKFVVLLENDWWCDTTGSLWLDDAIDWLSQNPDAMFVKLRRTPDQDDCGYGKPDHAPWTIESQLHEWETRIWNGISGTNILKAFPGETSFTFNPVIIKRNYLMNLIDEFRNEVIDGIALRTAENGVDRKWRLEKGVSCGVMLPGIFRHMGFYGRRNRLTRLPVYVAIETIRLLSALVRGSKTGLGV